MMMMYGQQVGGLPPHDTIPAPNVVNITSNSRPSALVQSVKYMGPARTFYLLSMICMPAWGDLSAIKFFGRDSVTPIQVPACASLTMLSIPIALPMVPGAAYVTGVADGVVAVMTQPQANLANVVYAVVYTGQYRLN